MTMKQSSNIGCFFCCSILKIIDCPGRMISKRNQKSKEEEWRKWIMKEYSKGIYVKFKPEEVEMIHERMKEAGVQNMSAFIRKMALNGYMIIPEYNGLIN